MSLRYLEQFQEFLGSSYQHYRLVKPVNVSEVQFPGQECFQDGFFQHTVFWRKTILNALNSHKFVIAVAAIIAAAGHIFL